MAVSIETPGVYNANTDHIDMSVVTPESLLPKYEANYNELDSIKDKIALYAGKIQSAISSAQGNFSYVQGGRQADDDRGQDLTQRFREPWAGARAIKMRIWDIRQLCSTLLSMTPYPGNTPEDIQGTMELQQQNWVNP